MSLTLDLPQELERELAAEATQLGLSLTEYALHLLVTRTRASHMPITGTELVAYWQREGVIGSRPAITIAKCMPVRYATAQKDKYGNSQTV
jgi:hypothetical protein